MTRSTNSSLRNGEHVVCVCFFRQKMGCQTLPWHVPADVLPQTCDWHVAELRLAMSPGEENPRYEIDSGFQERWHYTFVTWTIHLFPHLSWSLWASCFDFLQLSVVLKIGFVVPTRALEKFCQICQVWSVGSVTPHGKFSWKKTSRRHARWCFEEKMQTSFETCQGKN